MPAGVRTGLGGPWKWELHPGLQREGQETCDLPKDGLAGSWSQEPELVGIELSELRHSDIGNGNPTWHLSH